MDDQELEGFSLDDIMREFHTDKPADSKADLPDEDPDFEVIEAEESEAEAPEEAPAQDFAPAEDPEQTPAEAPEVAPDAEEPEDIPEEKPEESGETEENTEESENPEDADTPAPRADFGDTIRMDPVVLPKGQVRDAEPAEAPQEEKEEDKEESHVTGDTIRMEAVKPKRRKKKSAEESPEAFTERWEPEYEQPMGEYVPPQPIVFQPRSRLRELKRQLVAGPEKKYYELSEKGVGKLQAAIFLSMLVVLLSGLSTVLYAMGKVQPNRIRLLVFAQIFSMLLSALLGSFQLIEGLTDPFRKRFSLNTLLVITFGICCADAFFCLKELRVPCCAAFSLEVTMSLCSTYHTRVTLMGQMDTLRKANRLNGLCAQADYKDDARGFLKKEAQVDDFMKQYAGRSGPQKIMDLYALAAFLVCAAIGVIAGLTSGSMSTALQVSAVSLLAAVPATAFITFSRPGAILERRLHRLGTVICGWQGVKGLCGKAVFPLTHEDLFPIGTVKMNGVKFFGSRDPDEVVAYSTALIIADNSGLAPLFTQVLESRNGRHYDAEEFQIYEDGIGGVVCGEPVLAGSAAFLRQMGVDVPEGMRVNNAVYVAVDGELCGLFAMTYDRSKSTAAGLNTLCAHGRLNPLLVDTDFSLTEETIRSRLGIRSGKLLIPARETRTELNRIEPDPENPTLVITTRDGLAPLAYGVTGGRVLRSTSMLGLIIHMVGGIVGMGIMLVLVLMGGLHLLTPANLFLYQLIWMIPGFLITEWARAI